jgi:hypothetical protein
MKISTGARFLSNTFLTFASVLAGYGLFDMSKFVWYTGLYFDNGLYPFIWGCLFLLIGQVFRLQQRRQFMGVVAISGLLLFLWKRATIPAITPTGHSLFPDAELLNSLILVCILLLGLVLADRHVQSIINVLIVRPFQRIARL